MERKAFKYLEKWYQKEKRKPLILRGARQVGKSTLVRLLAKRLGLQLVEFNFEIEKLKSAQSKIGEKEMNSFQFEHLIAEIESKKNTHLDKNCLLFFDEIQQQSELIPLLRYFYEKRPDVPLIAAGSLLEFALEKKAYSMPVGRIEYFHLSPMDFEEFLLATGKKKLNEQVNLLFNKNLSYPELFQVNWPSYLGSELTQAVKDYLYVGGMPEAVDVFARTRSPIQVRDVHRSILQTYKDDFSKYATPATTVRLEELFNRLHLFIGKKVKYSELLIETRNREIKSALNLLFKARLLLFCKHTNGSGLPLRSLASDEVFKFYFLDVGLLGYLQGHTWSEIHNFNDLTLLTKGDVAEQFLAQHLAYLDRGFEEPELFYWLRDGKSVNAELDFLFSCESQIYPIEVKAGKSGKMKSLVNFCSERKLKYAFRFDMSEDRQTTLEDVSYKLPATQFKLFNFHLGLITIFIKRTAQKRLA